MAGRRATKKAAPRRRTSEKCGATNGKLEQPKSPMPPQHQQRPGRAVAVLFARPAQPEEIAPAFVYFASEVDSSYVTGEVLTLLGGETTAA